MIFMYREQIAPMTHNPNEPFNLNFFVTDEFDIQR